MEIYIFVQYQTESAESFANRITKFCAKISTEALEVQFTTASNGRQTCNIIWNKYKTIKVSKE